MDAERAFHSWDDKTEKAVGQLTSETGNARTVGAGFCEGKQTLGN